MKVDSLYLELLFYYVLFEIHFSIEKARERRKVTKMGKKWIKMPN